MARTAPRPLAERAPPPPVDGGTADQQKQLENEYNRLLSSTTRLKAQQERLDAPPKEEIQQEKIAALEKALQASKEAGLLELKQYYETYAQVVSAGSESKGKGDKGTGGEKGGKNMLYAEFQNGTDGNVAFKTPPHFELFDLDSDPWQMKNLYGAASEAERAALHAEVHRWLACREDSCP